MFGMLALIAFRLGEKLTGRLAGGQTLAFMVLALSQVIQAFNMRSEHSLFKIGPFSNRKLNVAALVSVLMVALVLFTPLSAAFELIALPATAYLIGLGLTLIPLVVMEISKACSAIRSPGITGEKRHGTACGAASRPPSVAKGWVPLCVSPAAKKGTSLSQKMPN